jgi:hypothetical protein
VEDYRKVSLVKGIKCSAKKALNHHELGLLTGLAPADHDKFGRG